MERRGVLILTTTLIAFGTGTPYLLMLLRKGSDVPPVRPFTLPSFRLFGSIFCPRRLSTIQVRT
jgi:hypothetical protein